MEQEELSEDDLIPCIGSLTMVKEVLAGRQPLTIDMAKDLETSFGILIKDLLQKGEGR
jgi:HTH-type transcriptional regulator/antitoxin HigA